MHTYIYIHTGREDGPRCYARPGIHEQVHIHMHIHTYIQVVRMAQEVMQDPAAMNKYTHDPDVLRAIKKIKEFMTS
jgi:hypothetical protein